MMVYLTTIWFNKTIFKYIESGRKNMGLLYLLQRCQKVCHEKCNIIC